MIDDETPIQLAVLGDVIFFSRALDAGDFRKFVSHRVRNGMSVRDACIEVVRKLCEPTEAELATVVEAYENWIPF